MPIEIRELHIRVNVHEEPSGDRVQSGGQPESRDKDDMVRACVEKVLEVLRDEKKR